MAGKGQEGPGRLVPASRDALREQRGPVGRTAAGLDGLPLAKSDRVNTTIIITIGNNPLTDVGNHKALQK